MLSSAHEIGLEVDTVQPLAPLRERGSHAFASQRQAPRSCQQEVAGSACCIDDRTGAVDKIRRHEPTGELAPRKEGAHLAACCDADAPTKMLRRLPIQRRK